MDSRRLKTIGLLFIIYSLILSISVICIPDLHTLSPHSFVFWLVTIWVKFLYVKLALSNPGFLEKASPEPLKNIKIVTDREEASNKTSTNQFPPSGFEKLNEELPEIPEVVDETVSQNVNANEEENEGEAPEHSDTTYSGDSNEEEIKEDIQVLEKRFCAICDIEQPIRCKHCKDCARCVTLHDHHCPWLGVCIGEYNRRTFFFYVFFQTTQLWNGLILVLVIQAALSFEVYDSQLETVVLSLLRAALVLLLAFFTFMLTCLFGFHCFLASKNFTTWEFLSWNRIGYLKDLDKAKGSPFSKGIKRNLYLYFCESLSDTHKVWELPS